MAVSKEEFAKFVQQVENKLLEMERAASIKQMATDANWQALKQEMTQNTDSDVDQATAKFTQLELQARAQQEFAQQIIAAAKQEFEDEKRVINGTADRLHQTVAAIQRLSVLEDQVKQFQNMDHSAAMKSLNTRLDTLEAVGAGAGVTVSATKEYLPESRHHRRSFMAVWRSGEVRSATSRTFSTRRTQACTCFWKKLRRAEMSLSRTVSFRSGPALGPE